VWGEGERRFAAGAWRLAWNRATRGGGSAGPGLYFARITVDGKPYVRRFAIVR